MISLSEIASVAGAQRHLPLRDSAIQHFHSIGMQPADVYGAMQNLVTLFSCHARVRQLGEQLDPIEAQRVMNVLLARLKHSLPAIATELLREPSLIAPSDTTPFPRALLNQL